MLTGCIRVSYAPIHATLISEATMTLNLFIIDVGTFTFNVKNDDQANSDQ